ncbi:hypothetical protein JR064_06535 [Xanthomonas sp. CFBP 8703]|jgi:hypothetical protein|uniref:Uncharacterized protein n=1 Tax=Xanthomonas bonasiae TaxID=2810351 RepID=A0ABS3B0D9_9XANT|nr:hypothetical protein [Xanthomonas bonasiae]MBN6101822.1 hypothetical protein [Xanthomonas bonasiae]
MEIASVVPARRASPIRVSAAGTARGAAHGRAHAAGAMRLPARARHVFDQRMPRAASHRRSRLQCDVYRVFQYRYKADIWLTNPASTLPASGCRVGAAMTAAMAAFHDCTS